MKVYVAGSISDTERVAQVAEAIEDAGHRITFKWWTDEGEIRAEFNGKSWADDPDRAREIAMKERQACWDADAGVYVWHEHGHGSLIESGMILCEEKDLIVLGCVKDSIFWYLPDVYKVDTVPELLDILREADVGVA